MEAKNILITIGIIALILFAINNAPKIPFQSIFSDTETQLKQEYNTYWSNKFDGDITAPNGENDKFIWSSAGVGLTEITDNGNAISTYGNIRTTKDFYGQEVVLLLRMIDGNAKINGMNFGSLENPSGTFIIKFTPHTLDNSKVDVYFNSPIPRATLSVAKPFYIDFDGQGVVDGRMVLDFIGYKAQFQCDLAPDERPIAQSFASPFTQNDLDFPVTKWMYPCRPATLRDLEKGETPITPNPYPSLNKGEIQSVPPNSFITVHYATPNVAGIEQPCDPATSAYIKIGNVWVCQKLIPTATTIYRNITKEEIIPVYSATSFILSKPNLYIGNSLFSSIQQFDCGFPNDVDIVRPPEPQGCYSSTINYEGKSYKLKHKEMASLNENIAVQYFAGGELTRTENKLVGTYFFNVKNAMELSTEGGITLKHKEAGKIRINLVNNLPANNIIIRINQKIRNTNQNLPEKTIIFKAIKGNNIFDVDVDTTNLGVNELIIQAFYPIEADGKVQPTLSGTAYALKINIEILGEQPSIVNFVEKEKLVYTPPAQKDIEEKAISFFKSIPTALKVIGGLLIFFIILRLL